MGFIKYAIKLNLCTVKLPITTYYKTVAFINQ